MKRFLAKRWHRIPIALVSAVLLVCLLAGSVLAAYGFFQATVSVEVREAIAPSYGWSDDLAPYMIPVGSVPPLITAVPDKWRVDDGLKVATFTIAKNDDIDASEFVAGEQLVIPIALRNRGDAPLTVTATVVGSPGLTLQYVFETNTTGAVYKATGTWAALKDFTTVLAPHGGNFGSAQIGAQVLFVKITAANDIVPGTYTVTFALNRS